MFRPEFKQQHFVVYELVLPYCSVCTPISSEQSKWHTPVLCEESSDKEYSLFFTKSAAPLQKPPFQSIDVKSPLNSSVFKCVTSGSEVTATLKPGEGLSSRGNMSFSCADFAGDPGPINMTADGTFFGKLKARNVLEGKKVITHYYTIVDGVENPVEVGRSTHYITGTQLSGGVFKLNAKDALKDIEKFSEQFPAPTNAVLSADINTTTTTLPIIDTTPFNINDVVIVDKELFLVTAVNPTSLSTQPRGHSPVIAGENLYKTEVAEHDEGATVQICYYSVSSNALVLYDIFAAIGLAGITAIDQWEAELTEWNNGQKFVGLYTEPKPADELINEILTMLMADMWLDQSTQKLVLSAVSAWRENADTLVEGDDFNNLTISEDENSRFSRAHIWNTKPFKAEPDDAENFSKLTVFTDQATETDDLYGSVKVKEFDPSSIITPPAADILTSRYVQRFSRTPKTLSFEMEERKLALAGGDLKLGSIVDVVSRESQTASGALLQARDRVQIISVKPDLNKVGRTYKVRALSYVPLIASNPSEELVITVTGTVLDLDLFARAGAPNVPINVTFIFSACTIGSTSSGITSVRAGNFEAGSRIKIICTGNTKWSGMGGKGGDAYCKSSTVEATASQGGKGANSYFSNNIETHIYLNYGTVDNQPTSASMFAAGGGSGGAAIAVAAKTVPYQGVSVFVNCAAAVSGSGGSGIPDGQPGVARSIVDQGEIAQGETGTYVSGGGSKTAAERKSAQAGGYGPKVTLTTTATTSAAGTSDDAGAGSAFYQIQDDGILVSETKTAKPGGLAGGAIKGTNVTVYNLDAHADKLKYGNSDAFILVTV